MAFRFVRNNSGQNFPVIEQLPAKASTSYKPGMLLSLTGGFATPAATNPTHVCAKLYDAPAKDAETVSAYPILPGQQWETTFAADGTAIVPGNKVTVNTDFEQVTATTTAGIFMVMEKLGTGAVGTAVIGEF